MAGGWGSRMSLAKWLRGIFGSRDDAEPPVKIAKGRGYTFNIVGESQFQDVLDDLAGPKTVQGTKVDWTAELIVDDANEHDEDAIAVLIAGKVVGFVPRDEAASTRADLDLINPAGRAVTCYARIVGGWRTEDGDEGSYGVKLSISKPMRLE
jgi:hypothetical protein